jgi:hypothetical protein
MKSKTSAAHLAAAVLALCLVGAVSAEPAYIPIGGNPDRFLLLDVTSIAPTAVPTSRTAAVVWVAKVPTDTPHGPMAYYITWETFDCTARTIVIDTVTDYDEAGQALNTEDHPKDGGLAKPQTPSVGARSLDLVCGDWHAEGAAPLTGTLPAVAAARHILSTRP